MNQKGFINIIIIVIVVVLAGAGVYFVSTRQIKPPTPTPSPSPTPTPPSDTSFKPSPLVLESISPSSGSLGTKVIIRGLGFTSTNNDVAFTHSKINFRGRNTAYLNKLSSQDGTTLRFSIPDNANVLLGACASSQMKPNEACPSIGILLPEGNVKISLVNKNGVSNSITFTVAH